MALSDYIKETRAELQHVNWPTRQQAVQFTVSVIIISAATSFILFGLDKLFVGLLTTFILN